MFSRRLMNCLMCIHSIEQVLRAGYDVKGSSDNHNRVIVSMLRLSSRKKHYRDRNPAYEIDRGAFPGHEQLLHFEYGQKPAMPARPYFFNSSQYA